jgi:hypothetical protein
MFSEDFVALTPNNFFALRCDCLYRAPKSQGSLGDAHLLPSFEDLCNEEPFASVAMGWNEEGLFFDVYVDKPVERTFYPSIDKGDGVELFIDTRDIKSTGFNTRFCHHFFFLPQPIDGHEKGEITHFRTEDQHELCDPKDLKVRCHATPHSYHLNIFLPSHCLVGYDPAQFDRLGFTYRIHRVGGGAQHFSVSSEDYAIDAQPSLWSSVQLVNN